MKLKCNWKTLFKMLLIWVIIVSVCPLALYLAGVKSQLAGFIAGFLWGGISMQLLLIKYDVFYFEKEAT